MHVSQVLGGASMAFAPGSFMQANFGAMEAALARMHRFVPLHSAVRQPLHILHEHTQSMLRKRVSILRLCCLRKMLRRSIFPHQERGDQLSAIS